MIAAPFVVFIFSIAIMVLGADIAAGQDYPNRPIRILTSAAGGGSDFTSRQIAQGISGPLGQQVIVDNRPNVLIGALIAIAPPDGYTLYVGGSSLWSRAVMAKVPYDPVKDFLPITLSDSAPDLVIAHPSLPVKSIKELITVAKARPGEINFSTSGVGSIEHLIGELLKSTAGIDIVPVAYKGTSLAVQALLGGEAQVAFATPVAVAPFVASGKLRILAVTSAKQSALVPGVPTMIESGLPGFVFENVSVVMAPAKTPTAIITRLNQEIVRALNNPTVKARFLSAGTEVVGSSPEQLAAYRDAEMAMISKVMKQAGLKAAE